jgi:predicted AAA+ superfamily ATPase
MRGSVFESLVVSDLIKNRLHHGLESNLYFWLNSSGNEVDVILDWGETFVPVEIKSAKTVASDFFEGINYWRSLAGDAQQPAALVYGGDMTLRRSDVCVYSWQVL